MSSNPTHAVKLAWIPNVWIAVFLAAVGGFLLDIATSGVGFWPASFLGIALILVSLWGHKPHTGFFIGIVGGAFFWMPHISWLTLYLGPIPWSALSVVMILWMGLAGAAIGAVTRWLPMVLSQSRIAKLSWLVQVLLATVVSGIWVTRELLQATWPYGGFAWGKVATMLASSPFASLASWLGFAAMSGLFVFFIALLIQQLHALRDRGGTLSWLQPVGVGILLIALAFVPHFALEQTGSTRLGAVQGNSDAGIFADRQPGDIFDDHLRASQPLIGESLDFFVWPEAAVDLDPLRDPEVSRQLDTITRELGAPLVTGIITSRGGLFYNSSIVWNQDEGVVDQYDKRRPVPFAEYMPNRSFFRAIVPELVDLVRLDYTAGDASSTVQVAGITAGIAICFDIIFDDLAVDMVDQGAVIVLAQTNNADFGRTDESAQQLEIARLRAIEMGRVVVVISTVGTSAIVQPDGASIDALVPFTEDTMVATVPLFTGVTPAIAFGWLFAGGFVLVGAVGLLGSIAFSSYRAASGKHKAPQENAN